MKNILQTLKKNRTYKTWKLAQNHALTSKDKRQIHHRVWILNDSHPSPHNGSLATIKGGRSLYFDRGQKTKGFLYCGGHPPVSFVFHFVSTVELLIAPVHRNGSSIIVSWKPSVGLDAIVPRSWNRNKGILQNGVLVQFICWISLLEQKKYRDKVCCISEKYFSDEFEKVLNKIN